MGAPRFDKMNSIWIARDPGATHDFPQADFLLLL